MNEAIEIVRQEIDRMRDRWVDTHQDVGIILDELEARIVHHLNNKKED